MIGWNAQLDDIQHDANDQAMSTTLRIELFNDISATVSLGAQAQSYRCHEGTRLRSMIAVRLPFLCVLPTGFVEMELAQGSAPGVLQRVLQDGAGSCINMPVQEDVCRLDGMCS